RPPAGAAGGINSISEERPMRMIAVTSFAALLVAVPARAQEPAKPPAPQKEHEWLKQLEGEWETEAEMVAGPGTPALKCKGTESTRVLGGYWVVSEYKGSFMDIPVIGLMTLGFDPQKKKYVGTWVCSMEGHLWKYEGTVNGQVLTLETEGPNPAAPGKV